MIDAAAREGLAATAAGQDSLILSAPQAQRRSDEHDARDEDMLPDACRLLRRRRGRRLRLDAGSRYLRDMLCTPISLVRFRVEEPASLSFTCHGATTAMLAARRKGRDTALSQHHGREEDASPMRYALLKRRANSPGLRRLMPASETIDTALLLSVAMPFRDVKRWRVCRHGWGTAPASCSPMRLIGLTARLSLRRLGSIYRPD